MTASARRGGRATLEDLLSLDLRALAVFRIALSLVLLYDLFDRSRDLVAHYTDQGVLPAQQAVEIFGRGVNASIHFQLSGSAFAIACLFAIACVCAVALGVGYRTRLATGLSWYLLASLQVRNPWVNGMSGDALLLAMLFWGIFLPLGAWGSIDARRRGETPRETRVYGVATAAYLVQLLVVYWSTGLLKSGEDWAEGGALFYALQLEHFGTPFTHLLLEQTWAHAPLTYAARAFEILGPFLLVVPFWLPLTRMLAVALFVGFHISLGIFLNVGAFPIICIAAWLAFLPGALFDEWLPRLLGSLAPRPSAVGDASSSEVAVRRAQGVGRWIDWALVIPLSFIVLQAVVKLGWLDLGYGRGLPPAARSFGQVLRLNQNWGMFSPDPSRYTLWLGVEGRLANGDTIDPFGNMPVRQSIPDDIAGASRGYRWRAYTWTALLTKPTRPTLEMSHRDFAAFLCREWNATHSGPQRLEGLRSIGLWRHSTPTGAQDVPPSLLYEYRCDGVGRLVWSAARRPGRDRAPRR